MNRALSFLATAGVALTLATPVSAQSRPPNIVVIVADDMGYADIGPYGAKDIPTPNLDALAAGGIRFTDGYVTGPYCSPTRAGLLTGRYPQRFGHEFNIAGRMVHPDEGLPLTETTLADRLKAAGYRTGLIGKWHLGFAPRFFPTRRGFDEFFGFLSGAHSYVNVTQPGNPIYDGETLVPRIPYLTDTLAGHAEAFIKRNRTRPFLLYLAFNAVHVPLQATDKYLARVSNIANPTRRTYAAMLSAMDDGIGRALAALRSEGLEENTLIFFFSDNGGPMDGDSWNGSSNVPFRGDKGETWEGGIRVPFIMSWKGRLPAGKTDSRPVIQLDVLPTALAAAGIPILPEWKLDGVNLLPFLTGQASGAPHEALYWRTGDVMAIRKGEWKLVKTYSGGSAVDPGTPSIAGAKLFNLKDDVGEVRDLAGAQPAKLGELRNAWERWNSELAKPAWTSMEMMISFRRSCGGTQPAPGNLAGYAGTWSGRLLPATGDSAIASFTWTQGADSAGTWRFATEATPTAARVVLASADSILVEVVRPGAGFFASVDGAPLRVAGQACGNELLGQLRARLPGGGAVRYRLIATRSP